MIRFARSVAVIGVAALLAGCDLPSWPRKLVSVDGVPYVVCTGFIRVTGEGGGLFSPDTHYLVSLDAVGLGKQTIHGAKKVHIMPIPPDWMHPMPTKLPDPAGRDESGLPIRANTVYTWPDGSKAELVGNQWVDVPACATQ